MESLPLCSWYFGGPGCDLVSPADSSNPNPIIDSEQVRLGKCAERESLQRMKSYSGFADDSDDELKVNMKWLTSISREGVSVESSAVIGSFWQAIRATTEIRGEKMAILNLLMDDSRIREYDDVFDFSQPLLRLNERTSVRRICYKPVWPTAPRDFLCCTTWQELEDGSLLICTRSVPNEVLEVEESYVRGEIIISGYWIQPCKILEKDDAYFNESSYACKVTLIAHTDLGGSMPAWLINLLSAETPLKLLIKIRGIFDKSDSLHVHQ